MAGGNHDLIVRLTEEFNSAQKDYKVVPVYKGSYADTMTAGLAAFRAGIRRTSCRSSRPVRRR